MWGKMSGGLAAVGAFLVGAVATRPAGSVLVLATLPILGVVDVYYRMNTTQVFLWALCGAAATIGLRSEVVGDDLVEATRV